MKSSELGSRVFPLVVPPDEDEAGLGIILLELNADTHFSFANALGMISADQMRAFEIVRGEYPQSAAWVVALHHHAMEYPWAAKALSMRSAPR